MNRMFLVILFSISLIGCFATTGKYEATLGTWVGHSADDLVSAWGVPNNSFTKSDGGMILEYYRQRNVQMGGYTSSKLVTTDHYGTVNAGNTYGTYSGTSTTYVPVTSPTYNLNFHCKTIFVTNSMRKITNWRWEGNNCKSR